MEAAMAPAAVTAPATGLTAGPSTTTVEGRHLGRLSTDAGALERYCEKVLGALDGRTLSGMKVAIDCANGAAHATAPRILTAAGASVVAVLADQPDGTNINAACGSTDPSRLAEAVTRGRGRRGPGVRR